MSVYIVIKEYDKKGPPLFQERKEDSQNSKSEIHMGNNEDDLEYRVIGTIWDYAPVGAFKWKPLKHGHCTGAFYDEKGVKSIYTYNLKDYLTETGVTEILRPDWAK